MSTSYSEADIHAKLATLIHEALRVPIEDIVPGATIFDDLGAESIDILDIRFRIEEGFGFKIEEGEIIRSIDPALSLEELKDRFTVGSIADFIRTRLDLAGA